MSHGDFNTKTKVTEAMKLKWWFDHIKVQYRIIDHGNPGRTKQLQVMQAHKAGSQFLCPVKLGVDGMRQKANNILIISSC